MCVTEQTTDRSNFNSTREAYVIPTLIYDAFSRVALKPSHKIHSTMKYMLQLLAALLVWAACGTTDNTIDGSAADVPRPELTANLAEYDTATFAGGCFWCTEAVFERVEGVRAVVSGYSGGSEPNPTYKQVANGLTTHAEAINIYYDSDVISYKELLEIFFLAAHDPTTLNRQGPDVGPQYRSAVYYRTPSERKLTEELIKKIDASDKYGQPIVTEVAAFDAFYPAEDYHQNYYELNPQSGYIQRVSRPKVEKFMKLYQDKLKPQYRDEVK